MRLYSFCKQELLCCVSLCTSSYICRCTDWSVDQVCRNRHWGTSFCLQFKKKLLLTETTGQCEPRVSLSVAADYFKWKHVPGVTRYLHKSSTHLPPRHVTTACALNFKTWNYSREDAARTEAKVTHHLIVLLRLGWLTVLSSMNIVEQELYFFVRSPGDICCRRGDGLRSTRATGEVPA